MVCPHKLDTAPHASTVTTPLCLPSWRNRSYPSRFAIITTVRYEYTISSTPEYGMMPNIDANMPLYIPLHA